ncbi:hypothetical protein NDS46_07155 [Paenibacillus thiaminolyticus]|uniref:hypothetical protein n=1 Tax=Paenibacillus thiaminolyticus TaxID=49283 RepID=UPI002330074F|nr:hypothetical protein [Paenibacillus thiaminolyticus]WCF09644.1 hypothetical protein NDS46_07155 [Paenibacillus thiaminolyticus]
MGAGEIESLCKRSFFMPNKEEYDASEKLVIEIGVKAAAKKYGISKMALAKWRRR